MPLHNFELIGGPPWGFRVSDDQQLRPIVTQTVSGGRAEIAGIRIGDSILEISGFPVKSCQESHNILNSAKGNIIISINRNPTKYHETIKQEKLSNSVQNSPISKRNRETQTKKNCTSSVPSSPVLPRTNSPRQVRMDMMQGSRTCTESKRRLFEEIAESSSPMVDNLLKRKIQMGANHPVTPSVSSVGYDSAAADFAGGESAESIVIEEEDDEKSKSEQVTIVENLHETDNFKDNQIMSGYDQNFGYYANNEEQNVQNIPPSTSDASKWEIRTEVTNPEMSSQSQPDIEIPERRNVAALRQVITDRLEMKTPVGGTSSSTKTPTPAPKPSWASNVKVYEPNGYIDPHANKNNTFGRVLEGPIDPNKFFQGVPPPSHNQVHQAKPPIHPVKAAIRCEPSYKPSKAYEQIFGNDQGLPDDLDDGASMISSCISTFGESSEIAGFSAAAAQRHLYDQYKRNLNAPNPDTPTSLFDTTIQLTPFGQPNIESIDLESSELLVKSKSPAPYTSNTAEHYATIRRKHTPVKAGFASSDSGYEGSNAICEPDQSTSVDKALNEALEIASSIASSMNGIACSTPQAPPTLSPHSRAQDDTNTLHMDESDPMHPKRHFHATTEPEMSLWYRKMFKEMHKPGSEIESNRPAIHQAERVEVDIVPRRAKSVGRIVEAGVEKSRDFGLGTKNRFALERSRTAHFHLPSHQFDGQVGGGCDDTQCMVCLKKMRRIYANLAVQRNQRESRRKIDLSCITQRLDETTKELDGFIKSLEKTWNRSKSQPVFRLTPKENNLGAEIEELKRISKEEVLLRQKAERLTDELQKEKDRKHHYTPSAAATSLHNNTDRFEGLVNNYSRPERSPMRNLEEDNYSQTSRPVISTATAIYKFDARSPRELQLNRGDIIRITREIDGHWLEGERNGKSGIFPASYVQIESEFERNRRKIRVVYPFTARNSNELSLKKGEIISFRREIDANWMEGSNQIGQIGIFPSSYVRMMSDPPQDAPAVIPDRPKTPKIKESAGDFELGTMQRVRFEDEHRADRLSDWETRKHNPVVARDLEPVVQQPNPDIRQNAASLIPKGSEVFRAIYPYKPEKQDELELHTNDIIFVVEKCDDGWFIGTSLRSGDFGIFPGNYVQRH